MIKRFSLKKIGKYTILLLAVFLLYSFPKTKEYTLEVSTNAKNIFFTGLNKVEFIYEKEEEPKIKEKKNFMTIIIILLIFFGVIIIIIIIIAFIITLI